jgi:dipeptide/tripeptide permease
MGRIGSIAAPFTMGVIGKTYGLQSGLAVTCAIYAVGVLMLLLLPETFQREAGKPVAA